MMPTNMSLGRLLVLLIAALVPGWPQSPELAAVVARPVSRTIDLPGEFQPFESASIQAKLRGYVERILVDRGSFVKRGQLLAELSAPELTAQIAEAAAKVQAAESDRLQSEAQLAAAQSTYDRLTKASETAGAIAGNELVQAQKQRDAAQALVQSKIQLSQAAQAGLRSQKDLAAYLRITAPFDGVVTERLVHPGALVGAGSEAALLVVQDILHLRLVVAVPEEYVGSIQGGAKEAFHTPAYPERTYSGTITRLSHTLDPKTRTMAVELDVFNRDRSLSPGMYPLLKWPVRRARPALFVPRTSVVTTTERTFVICNRNGRAAWVDVTKQGADGELIEVAGNLLAGDLVVRRATDEIREGAPLPVKK